MGPDAQIARAVTLAAAGRLGSDDELGLVAGLCTFIDLLVDAVTELATPAPVGAWVEALRRSVDALLLAPDDEPWHRRDLLRLLDELADEAVLGDRPSSVDVDPAQLAALLGTRLTGRPGRVRFGTGAVTLSSLAGLRGVPARVVVLLGVDGDPGSGVPFTPDDLIALSPMLGDRDPRAEVRAQLTCPASVPTSKSSWTHFDDIASINRPSGSGEKASTSGWFQGVASFSPFFSASSRPKTYWNRLFPNRPM